MMKERIIIAAIKSWNIANALKFKSANKGKYDVFIIDKNRDLGWGRISRINPRYIFFPHWSWVIPKKICDNFECVVFHMTDLPFGRGGSPLQNLIARGIYKTKVSAVRAVEDIDAGPVYKKYSIDLNGSAAEIFKKVSNIVFDKMIPYILKNMPLPRPQSGDPVFFKRRGSEQSSLAGLKDIKKVYDHIRMLDAEGYPKAFLEFDNLQVEFKKARLKGDRLFAEAKISMKEKK